MSRFPIMEEDSPDFSSNAAWTLSQSKTTTSTDRYGPIVLGADDQVSYTRRYAAPELLEAPPGMEGRNILVFDERVDYYSLGIMLRELALGAASEDFQVDFGQKWECSSDGATKEDVSGVDEDLTDFTSQVRISCPLWPFYTHGDFDLL